MRTIQYVSFKNPRDFATTAVCVRRVTENVWAVQTYLPSGEDLGPLISWHKNQAEARREFTRRCTDRLEKGYIQC